MNIFENELYRNDVNSVAAMDLPWDKLKDSSVIISGATGLIGSCFIDVLMAKNDADGLNCKVYALGRNKEKAYERFSYCVNDPLFEFITHDINMPLDVDLGEVGYVLHLASNTHPVQYANDPIGTITTNIVGTGNMLNFAVKCKARRAVLASSNEIYGENRGDTELFDENYCGYINSNTMRAGYPESKRCSEALCQAYIRQCGLDVVIPRLTRSYGPTMLMSDSKAVSQFIKKGLAREDIVLKSAGTQHYSFTYMADAVSGLLTVLLCGQCGEAYNIADVSGDIMLKDLAKSIADASGTKVVFELPDDVEKAGFSVATKARLAGDKLKALGWAPMYDINNGIERTMEIMRVVYGY